jgi:Entner-Doudoroff aldolase
MSDAPKTAIELRRRGPVIPVVVIDRAVDAVPLARALLAGGVVTMEITLRTPEAVDAIRSVAEHVPGMAVGAGTLIRSEQARHAVSAGATFLVSPGRWPKSRSARPGESTELPLVRPPRTRLTSSEHVSAPLNGGPGAENLMGRGSRRVRPSGHPTSL